MMMQRGTPAARSPAAPAAAAPAARLAPPARRRKALTCRAAASEPPVPLFDGASAASNDRSARAENVEGDFFVDHTCIDCDTCRLMAPETFSRVGEQSAVHAQPADEAGRVRALQALFSCPTFSIHVQNKTAAEMQAAQQGLPQRVPGTQHVYACGWRSVKSIACESYLVVRPGGNVLVDTPRFNPVLAKRLAELGGVKYIFLTHKDDVGEHAKWAAHFRAPRILHTDEVVPDTQGVEVKLAGEGPWRLPDGGDDVELIFTPGHTPAHVVALFKPDRALFTGDHLSGPPGSDTPFAAETGPDQDLFVFERFNWHSFPQQLESVHKLLQYDWLHVCPGHGRPAHLRDAAHRLEAVSKLLAHHGYTPAGGGGAAAAARA